MENTEANLQKRTTSQILEIVCSVILLVCLFLPWVTFEVGGDSTFGMSFGTSYSAFDAINMITKINNSSYLPSAAMRGMLPFVVFLYLILTLYIINPIVQYKKRLPWLSFYTAWIPVTAGFILLFKSAGVGSDGYLGFGVGAGAVLSLLAGLLMQFSAWTTIGIHYKEHRRYFWTALIWCIAGWVYVIGGAAIAVSNNSFLGRAFSDNIMLIILLMLMWIVSIIGIGHTLWLIYGGIVMLFSPKSTASPRQEKYSEKTDESLNQATISSHVEPTTSLQPTRDEDETSKIPAFPLTETAEEQYKAYQPSCHSSVPVINTDTVVQPKEVQPSLTRPSGKRHVVLFCILGAAVLLIAGLLTYFLWYMPYAKDRDALRTYVLANNVFLRSSRMTGVEYNILGKVPYGTEVITYNKFDDWAEVKVNDVEGVIAAPYLLESSEFTLLNEVWGDNDAKDCIESSKCRLAILDYLKRNRITSGSSGWQIYTKPRNQKPNAVFYPRLYDRYSKFTDFVFLIKDNQTGNRALVCYSFEDTTEKPIFRFSVGAPRTGYIKNIVHKYGGPRVIFDDNSYINISL